MRVAELEMHPADEADRRNIAQDDFGLGYCNITKCCTEVCPEHIKITDNAIIPMKERVAGRRFDPLVWLGSKISRRPEPAAPRRCRASASSPLHVWVSAQRARTALRRLEPETSGSRRFYRALSMVRSEGMRVLLPVVAWNHERDPA